MFQVLVRYFGDRCASFFVQEPILEYSLLLQRIKSAIPCFLQLQDEQIRIAYHDVQSGCFININPEDQLHLLEAFKNVVPSGHDRYNRIDLKVWESDSPSFLRKAATALDGSNANKGNIITDNCVFDSVSTDVLTKATKTPKRLDFSPDIRAAEVVDWKENKKEEISNKLQWLEDRKVALQTHIRDLEIPVEEPMRIGTYRTVCGNCHIRGHRADGNRNNDACNAPECVSYFMCGQKNKHPEHFDELKKNKKDLKDLTKEIENAQLEKKNLIAFQSKSISAFATAITPRLTRAFSEKYSLKTAKGKLALQKDISIIRAACKNKIPENTGDDKGLFTTLLEQQENVMSELKINSAASASTVNAITVAVSPVQPRNIKRKKLPEESDSCDVSSDSSASDSSPERKPHKKSKRARKSQKRRKKSQAKSSRKKRRRRPSTSSDSSSDSVSSNESLHEHKSHKQGMKGKLCVPENTVNISNTQYSQVERQREQCSLTELATIAVAINKEKGE